MNGGRVGLSVANTAVAKIQPDVLTLFIKGILCNLLVCMAVWLAYAGRSVTDKIVALVLPVSAFIAAGFEHCVANMYFLPLAWLEARTGSLPADFDASAIRLAGIIHNLVPVTLGNIVGGAGLVGLVGSAEPAMSVIDHSGPLSARIATRSRCPSSLERSPMPSGARAIPRRHTRSTYTSHGCGRSFKPALGRDGTS